MIRRLSHRSVRWLAVLGVLVWFCQIVTPDVSAQAPVKRADLGKLLAESDQNPPAKSFAAAADPVGALEIIAAEIEANYQRIRTWTGNYRFQDKAYLSEAQATGLLGAARLEQLRVRPPLIKKELGTVNFKIDLVKDALYAEYEAEPGTFKEGATLRDLEMNTSQFKQRSILTSEAYLHFQPLVNHGRFQLAPDSQASHGRAAFRDATDKSLNQEWGSLVDARKFFGYGRLFFEDFALFAKNLRDDRDGKAAKAITVHESHFNDVAYYRVTFTAPVGSEDSDKLIRLEITCDGSSGYHPIALEVTEVATGHMKQHLRWKWRLVDGIHIPAVITREVATADGEHFQFQRILTLDEVQLNGPVEESTFAWTNLGLNEGERLVDNIEGMVFVNDKGVLRPVDEVRSTASPPAIDSSNWFRVVLVTINAAFVLLLTFLVVRWRRKAH